MEYNILFLYLEKSNFENLMDPQTEYEHIIKLGQGNHESFRLLFMKYFPKLKYFIAHLIKSEEIAEELSQDIFAHIWENRESLSKINSFNSYIYRMAKNATINYLNHKFIEENYALRYNPEEDPTIEETFYAKEIELLIQLTVEKMPPQRKRVFEMSRIENLKNEEIATKLNLSKKTVENHLNLALKEIKRTLALSVLFFL